MFMPDSIDEVVNHIRTLVDSIRCSVCDTTNGVRMRYACGHTSCEDCVAAAVDCYLCLTPQTTPTKSVPDDPLTKRVQNANNLLNIFQNKFHIDVYKRHRISEQLKVEKELFPECIQAPVKYFNKRKSSKSTISNKENKLSQLPGEEISIVNAKMDRSRDNVEKWLNKHVRKPFADMNSNDENVRKFIIDRKINNTENIPVQNPLKRKRTQGKIVKEQKSDKIVTKIVETGGSKRLKVDSASLTPSIYCNNKDNDKDESGIVIDDESVIVIEDSQSYIDKDRLALFAVQEADKNAQCDSRSIMTSISSKLFTQTEPREAEIKPASAKVPFYLRSCLSRSCKDCSHNKDIQHQDQSNDIVSITIKSTSFTNFKVTNIENTNKVITMRSVEVQTDICKQVHVDENINDNPNVDKSNAGTMNKGTGLRQGNVTQNVIICESDSDEDIEESVTLNVTADIHRSCEEVDYNILADVENQLEHSKRTRAAPRRASPASSDSSDKENYNPNRQRNTHSKKKPMKK